MSANAWPPTLALPASVQRDHVRGSREPTVVLVEYGDYECPFCASAHGVVNDLQTHLGAKLLFVFRHFPLTRQYPHALACAEAAEAAGAQGKFWQMHETLYANRHRLDDASLILHAESVGLDIDVFHDDLATHRHMPKVRDDFTSGVRSGVNGTPTFFVNGIRHEGLWQFPSLLAAVQAAMHA